MNHTFRGSFVFCLVLILGCAVSATAGTHEEELARARANSAKFQQEAAGLFDEISGEVAAEQAEAEQIQRVTPSAPPSAPPRVTQNESTEQVEPFILPVGPVVVTLADQAISRYLQLSLMVMFSSGEAVDGRGGLMENTKEALVSLLERQVSTKIDSPQGKKKLQQELRDLFVRELHRADIAKVYFVSFSIQ